MSIKFNYEDENLNREEFLCAILLMRMVALEAGRASTGAEAAEVYVAMQDIEAAKAYALQGIAEKQKAAYDLFYPEICNVLYQSETDEEVSIVDYHRACIALASDFGAVLYVLEYLDAELKTAAARTSFELRSPWRLLQGYKATKQL